MQHNQSGMQSNNLNHQASLLMPATQSSLSTLLETVAKSSANLPPVVSMTKQQIANLKLLSSTPNQSLTDFDFNRQNSRELSPIFQSTSPTETYINFKKPQNEIFKKLDGKIQKIVAAHSNLNKLYALNEFSTQGVGPKRPFELPKKLPPPPPWVPGKSSDELGSPSSDEFNPSNHLMRSSPIQMDIKPNIHESTNFVKGTSTVSTLPTRVNLPRTSLSINSAITKLHQRRQQQRMGQRFNDSIIDRSLPREPTAGSSRVVEANNTNVGINMLNGSGVAMNPSQFNLMKQKLEEILVSERGLKRPDSGEDGKKYDDQFKNILKREIMKILTERSKAANTQFSSPPESRPKPKEQMRQSILKSSPQTLFNTIRRETSLLLNKQNRMQKPNLSLLNERTAPIIRSQTNQSIPAPAESKFHNIIKVVVPPTDHHPYPKCETTKNADGRNIHPSEFISALSKKIYNPSNTPQPSYQVIKSRIKKFQDKHHINIGKNGHNSIEARRASSKSLDRIVDKLQAKWTSTPMETEVTFNPSERGSSLQQQILESSASLLRSVRDFAPMCPQTPIPTFRPPINFNSKNGYNDKMRSKRSKRIQHFGLKFNNYLERECPQPNNEKITIDQFAKCLDLVRSNDAVVHKHQHRDSMPSDSKWRIPMVGMRQLRLRRLRGERMRMPASASYKATRRVGLK